MGGGSTRKFVLAGLGVAAVLAGGVSYLASGSPDGLDATTREGCTVDAAGEITGGSCIAQRAADHELGGSVLADYGVKGLDGSTGLAGLIGVVLTFAIGLGVFWLVRRRRAAAGAQAPAERVGAGN
ncbi:PDGLE domain-containing protein [Catellatospora sp. KI3]|uniref:PDGLE domain-containing protein n=1 Tax=Catellatospora sp. KI3 TaxID=3041620 RepID=UPI0024823318|nr:PDGLE domain-containing protein [Catellatospora sp. KI3]MDI1460587.1 PDGLE domain-containing protein [Catellatospora sp. KI3]